MYYFSCFNLVLRDVFLLRNEKNLQICKEFYIIVVLINEFITWLY